MRLSRIRRAACIALALAATAIGVQTAYGWSGTLYFNSTAAPGNPEYTPGWAYRQGNRMDTGTGFVPVEIWSLTSSYIVTDDHIGAGFAEITYNNLYRRQGCWNPGIPPFNYPYSFSCQWI